jgi:hypothetical protein
MVSIPQELPGPSRRAVGEGLAPSRLFWMRHVVETNTLPAATRPSTIVVRVGHVGEDCGARRSLSVSAGGREGRPYGAEGTIEYFKGPGWNARS